jgi:hypothetical protein
MAVALDAVAAPPGGWRNKSEPGTFTFSVTAHPGLFGGAELRWGPYGATHERGGVYGQLPTLAMPIGLEFAWGKEWDWPAPFAIFVPLVDPLAFLDYDVGKGRLPAPSLKTALSPGIGLRFGFEGTPFSLMPMVVYRPGLRLWKPEVGGNGADALQIGLIGSVDVTLFDFITRGTSK